ncbi:MAG: hypothetical protein GC138_03845 [Gammaproteobacteria bacterium]|nr:hypothetical protein [Gammaproteobacteria bacterium]
MNTAAVARPAPGMQRICRWLMVAMPGLLVLGPAPADIAATFIALCFLWNSYRQRDWSWCETSWVKAALGVWLMLLALSPFAYDVGQAYEGVLPWPRLILFAAAIQFWLLDDLWLRRLIRTTAVVLGLVAFDALWQYWMGADLLGHAPSDPGRLNGPFVRPKVGIFLAKFYFPTILGLLAMKRIALNLPQPSRLPAVAAVLLGVVLAVTVFLSGERMAFIMIALGLCMGGLLLRGAIRKILIALLIAGLVVTAGTAVFKHELVGRQLDSTVETLKHFKDSPYGQIWHNSLHLALQRPWTGIGLRNFKLACDDAQMALPDTYPLRCATHSHNIYIEWLTETGFPGLIGFVVVISLWGREAWRGLRSGNERTTLAGPVIAVTLMLWPVATTGSFFTNWNAVLFWLVLGWALGVSRLAQSRPR